MRFAQLPAGWRELVVIARATSPQLQLDGEGTIILRRGEPSRACQLVGRRRAGATGPLEVTVVFTHGDRWCGTAMQTFCPGAAAAPSVVWIEPGVPSADLTVHIHRTQADPRRLVWTLLPANAHRALIATTCAESTLTEQPHATDTPDLQAIGDLLWGLAPPAFRDGYGAMRAALGDRFTIQLVTDETSVPWELMRPPGVGRQALGQTHPIARALHAYPHRLLQRLTYQGAPLSIAPDYHRSGLPPLPAAREESDALRRRYKARQLEPVTARALLDTLAGKVELKASVLHFAGYGRAAPPRLACEDRDVSLAEIRCPETRLGEQYGTFVLLGVRDPDGGPGEVGVWAEALLHRAFSGVIAPVWASFDAAALEELWQAIVRNTVAEALRFSFY